MAEFSVRDAVGSLKCVQKIDAVLIALVDDFLFIAAIGDEVLLVMVEVLPDSLT